MQKLLQLIIGFSLLVSLGAPAVTLASSPASTPTDAYKISVKARFEGFDAEGIDIKLVGPGTTKSLTTSLSGVNEFRGLGPGNYTVEILLDATDEYQLVDSSLRTQNVSLSAVNPQDDVIYTLKQVDLSDDEAYQLIKGIKLPENLTKIGSKTTNFPTFPQAALKEVKNFTFDNPGVNKIVFSAAIDLSDPTKYSAITRLSDYIDLETRGKVYFAADLFPIFNKPAEITMSGLRLANANKFYDLAALLERNGSEFTPAEMTYSGSDLRFKVEGFSTYTLKPRLLVEPLNGQDLSKAYESLTATYPLEVSFDNLDADIMVSINGQNQNVAAKPDENGNLRTTLNLVAGENRIRVLSRLANGQEVDQFFTVNYGKVVENNVSTIFAVLFFLIIILLGVGIAVYYTRVRARRARELTAQKNPPLRQKIEYNPDLLTPEEKALYQPEKKPTAIVNVIDRADTNPALEKSEAKSETQPEVTAEPEVETTLEEEAKPIPAPAAPSES